MTGNACLEAHAFFNACIPYTSEVYAWVKNMRL